MRKKLLVLSFTLLLAFALAIPAMAADTAIKIDGQALASDAAPIVVNERVLAPMRAIFEALGATVNWDQATNTVVAVKGDTKIELTIGGEAKINGNAAALDVPAQVYQERTMVPLRFISEALGATVDWDGSTNTVSITSHAAPVEPVEPVTPVEPEEPVTPVEPIEVDDPEDPADPADLEDEEAQDQDGDNDGDDENNADDADQEKEEDNADDQ